MRYVGQSYELTIGLPDGAIDARALEDVAARFHAEHDRAYGHSAPDEPVELVNVRLTAIGRIAKPRLRELDVNGGRGGPALKGHRLVFFAETGGFVECPIYDRYRLAGKPFTHAVGHVRMATESRVDVAHSHPFWARPFPDVTVVHNGHLTNAHKAKRMYEMRGYRFQTENDTEFLAVFLADRMSQGLALDEAVAASIDDLDGSFTYLVSTKDGFGVARDRFSTKPCLVAETDDWVAVVSEGIALAGAFGDEAEIHTYELPGGQARAWMR
jgi:hypothetical protein